MPTGDEGREGVRTYSRPGGECTGDGDRCGEEDFFLFDLMVKNVRPTNLKENQRLDF